MSSQLIINNSIVDDEWQLVMPPKADEEVKKQAGKVVMFKLANVGAAVIATLCPIATSFAFTVTPVPAPTAISLVDAIVPPPVKPAPAVILTDVWSMCSFATKFVVESWSTCAELLNKVLLSSDSAVVTLVEKLALGAVNEPLIFDAI